MKIMLNPSFSRVPAYQAPDPSQASRVTAPTKMDVFTPSPQIQRQGKAIELTPKTFELTIESVNKGIQALQVKLELGLTDGQVDDEVLKSWNSSLRFLLAWKKDRSQPLPEGLCLEHLEYYMNT